MRKGEAEQTQRESQERDGQVHMQKWIQQTSVGGWEESRLWYAELGDPQEQSMRSPTPNRSTHTHTR